MIRTACQKESTPAFHFGESWWSFSRGYIIYHVEKIFLNKVWLLFVLNICRISFWYYNRRNIRKGCCVKSQWVSTYFCRPFDWTRSDILRLVAFVVLHRFVIALLSVTGARCGFFWSMSWAPISQFLFANCAISSVKNRASFLRCWLLRTANFWCLVWSGLHSRFKEYLGSMKTTSAEPRSWKRVIYTIGSAQCPTVWVVKDWC